MNLYRKVQVDIVVSTVDPGLVVAAARKALNTEHYGDGKIFVTNVEDVIFFHSCKLMLPHQLLLYELS